MNERTDLGTSRPGPGVRDVDGLLQAGAFWASVGLPIAYPVLLYGSITDHTRLALVGLLACHVACLVLGHDYER